MKAVPIVLDRLKEKQLEWMQARMMLTEQWKDTYDNAFYKVSVRCSSSAVQ